jgi:LysM repeat protein
MTVLKSRQAELCVMILISFGILTSSSTNAQGQTPIDQLLHKYAYIEEKALDLSPAYASSGQQIADIGTLFAATSGNGSGRAPMSTTEVTAMQGSTLVALAPPDIDYLEGFKAYQVIKYTVQSGDTIGGIASNFGVSVDTIIWANDLKNPNSLRLGQTVQIPPVTGVIHTVRTGDTVASIARKYKADSAKILSFNNLTNDQILGVGDALMIPGGQLGGAKPSSNSLAKGSGGSGIYVPVGDGQCVAFVRAHGFSTMSGNANTWKRYINTPSPATGGVVVLRGGRYGHVALVTAVKSNSIQIVEQNYYGPYIIDHREIPLNDRSIVGFIQ